MNVSHTSFCSSRSRRKERQEPINAWSVKQIDELSYEADLQARGITKICKIGVAFSGKRLKLVSDSIMPV